MLRRPRAPVLRQRGETLGAASLGVMPQMTRNHSSCHAGAVVQAVGDREQRVNPQAPGAPVGAGVTSSRGTNGRRGCSSTSRGSGRLLSGVQ